MQSHEAFLARLGLAAVAVLMAARVQAGAECVLVYCACDPPGVYQPCGTDCAARCGGKGRGAAVPSPGDFKQQLLMETTSTLVQGLLESIFSSDTAADDAALEEARRKLAEEEAKRRAEATRIAEAKRLQLVAELKGFRRVQLAFKGRPRSEREELRRAAALCRARLSAEALDLALAEDRAISAPAGADAAVTERQARAFAELRGESQRATRESAEAKQRLADAEAGLGAVTRALELARQRDQGVSERKGDVATARRTLEETEILARHVEERAREARTAGSEAQARMASALARQRQFACDPEGTENWCSAHPRPLSPVASVLEVGNQDETRWTAWVVRMQEWCTRCAQKDPGCLPDDRMPPRRPPARPGDDAASHGPFGRNDPPCGEGFLTGPTGGDFYFCCPEGFPYLSRCDQRCYSADAFNGGRIHCDDSWAGTVRCQEEPTTRPPPGR